MMFQPKHTAEQWAEARQLRAEGLTYRTISERVGILPNTISSRARKEGWSGSDTVPEPDKPQRRPSPLTADIRRALALRLYSLLDLRIQMMELSMKKQLDATAQGHADADQLAVSKDERQSFAALIESINQVTEMASEPATTADGGRKSAINPELAALSSDVDPDGLALASEKDALRRDIAERLAKLFPPA